MRIPCQMAGENEFVNHVLETLDAMHVILSHRTLAAKYCFHPLAHHLPAARLPFLVMVQCYPLKRAIREVFYEAGH